MAPKKAEEGEGTSVSALRASVWSWRWHKAPAASLDLAKMAIWGRFGLGFGQEACVREGDDDGDIGEGVQCREGSAPRCTAAELTGVAESSHPRLDFVHREVEEGKEAMMRS